MPSLRSSWRTATRCTRSASSPRGYAGGYTMYLPKEDKTYVTRRKLEDTIAAALGGRRVAEKLRLGDISTGAHSDLQHASEIAHRMVTEYGMSEEIGPDLPGRADGGVRRPRVGGTGANYSESLAARVDEAVQRILSEAVRTRRARGLGADMAALDRVAEMLIRYERVSGEEFAAVYGGEDADAVIAPPRAGGSEEGRKGAARKRSSPAAEGRRSAGGGAGAVGTAPAAKDAPAAPEQPADAAQEEPAQPGGGERRRSINQRGGGGQPPRFHDGSAPPRRAEGKGTAMERRPRDAQRGTGGGAARWICTRTAPAPTATARPRRWWRARRNRALDCWR